MINSTSLTRHIRYEKPGLILPLPLSFLSPPPLPHTHTHTHTLIDLTYQARSKNIDGNLSGDGLQNGGLLVVSKGGGEVLLNHREETPGDHVANDVILKALGITQRR